MARKRYTGRREDAARPPEGKPWVWLTADLIGSPAWRGQSLRCRRLIDFLLTEHMAHGGNENGKLVAPYDQLVKCGIARRFIKSTIDEAVHLRLIQVTRGGRKGLVANHLSRYRLTFVFTTDKNEFGHRVSDAASNEWESVTEKHVADFKATAPKNRKQVHPYGTRAVHTGELARCHTGELANREKRETAESSKVHPCELLSISRGGGRKRQPRRSTSDAPNKAPAPAPKPTRPRGRRNGSRNKLANVAERIATAEGRPAPDVLASLNFLVVGLQMRGRDLRAAESAVIQASADALGNPATWPEHGGALSRIGSLINSASATEATGP